MRVADFDIPMLRQSGEDNIFAIGRRDDELIGREEPLVIFDSCCDQAGGAEVAELVLFSCEKGRLKKRLEILHRWIAQESVVGDAA